ncbi:response regulator, partial [Deinococcus pimensis]|uniref:response regulator n=1 Tax=Deinococcus pimensis TaxID=309888 RepID=UPI000A0684A4
MPAELRRVLLVEDDPDIQAVALIALEDVGGLTVLACGSGREALEAAPDFRADVVLLDVMMPGMSGPDTLRALRERPETREVPVVFMTARVQRHEVDEYLTMGAIGVIPKPFEPMSLADELRSLLEADVEAREERDFQAQLSALRGQFEQGLGDRLARLRGAW